MRALLLQAVTTSRLSLAALRRQFACALANAGLGPLFPGSFFFGKPRHKHVETIEAFLVRYNSDLLFLYHPLMCLATLRNSIVSSRSARVWS